MWERLYAATADGSTRRVGGVNPDLQKQDVIGASHFRDFTVPVTSRAMQFMEKQTSVNSLVTGKITLYLRLARGLQSVC
jgi:hypothetical protein